MQEMNHFGTIGVDEYELVLKLNKTNKHSIFAIQELEKKSLFFFLFFFSMYTK